MDARDVRTVRQVLSKKSHQYDFRSKNTLSSVGIESRVLVCVHNIFQECACNGSDIQ